MRFLLASLSLIVIVGVCNVESLKCYVCANCANMGVSTTCTGSTETRCMENEVSDVLTKSCATLATCASQHATADSSATQETECCHTDNCNDSGAQQHLPSLLLLILPAIFASFFKN